MKAQRVEVLPVSLPPRGLNREQAAAYIGVSTSLFDEMTDDGRMPRPKKANARNIWDRFALDKAFTRLPGGGGEEDTDDWETQV
ncbi:hypothetical protein NBH19_09005 [Rhizobium sp. S95]|uniref:Uncharacterized protein n=1 Tax=Ciceribacter sichuanensis TaxID=2949647 RepID=A0AAJ1BZ44_9HYPH|nr:MULTISPECIES: hypothetical protein [unclassified Ciceribacter]MCM2396216.1 hypothetical protein [Ciceribacter sp. S95]MCO5957633.1 hypothetical protein [Ciceribacter sp. S101]